MLTNEGSRISIHLFSVCSQGTIPFINFYDLPQLPFLYRQDLLFQNAPPFLQPSFMFLFLSSFPLLAIDG